MVFGVTGLDRPFFAAEIGKFTKSLGLGGGMDKKGGGGEGGGWVLAKWTTILEFSKFFVNKNQAKIELEGPSNNQSTSTVCGHIPNYQKIPARKVKKRCKW